MGKTLTLHQTDLLPGTRNFGSHCSKSHSHCITQTFYPAAAGGHEPQGAAARGGAQAGADGHHIGTA